MQELPSYGIYASKREVARGWYNVRTNMKEDHEPLLSAETKKPMTAAELGPLIGTAQAEHELNAAETFMDAPKEMFSLYQVWRPAPLVRALRLEERLETPAKIYYKFEGTGPSCSYKINAAAVQGHLAKEQGYTGIITYTGSGEWGVAMAMACAFYGLDLIVYVPEVTVRRKPYARLLMESYGAAVISSPSKTTEVGRKLLAQGKNPDGNLTSASSEAWESAAGAKGFCYVQDGVLDHALLYNAPIGKDTKPIFLEMEEFPDILVGSYSGSSGWSGLMASFMRDRVRERHSTRFIAAEPAACPNLTRGRYAYDYLNLAEGAPLAKMYTLGTEFVPSSIQAADFCYHGVSPIISKLYHDGYIEAVAYEQKKAFEAAALFARAEGILPTAECAYVIRAVLDEALHCRESGESKNILFGISGTGHLDMAAYQSFADGVLEEHIPTDEELEQSWAGLPKV